MKKVISFVKIFLHPPKWLLWIISPVVFTALIYIFIAGKNDSVSSYIIYGVSAYCLTALVLPLPRRIKIMKAYIMRGLTGTKLGNKYINNIAFRGSVGICQGMTADFLYAVFRFAAGVIYSSVWFISMAVYYLVLGILRLVLILDCRRKNGVDELSCYRRTAVFLLFLNIPMGVIILLTVFADCGYFYPGYVVYISAMYTFYKAVISVINLVRFRRLGRPILYAAKLLNFTAALMSLLGLQTAMIAQFSQESESFRISMNAATGATVWVTVILIAVCMLLRGRKMKVEVMCVEPLGK